MRSSFFSVIISRIGNGVITLQIANHRKKTIYSHGQIMIISTYDLVLPALPQNDMLLQGFLSRILAGMRDGNQGQGSLLLCQQDQQEPYHQPIGQAPFRSPLRRTKKRDIEFVFFLPCLSCFLEFPQNPTYPRMQPSSQYVMAWNRCKVKSNSIHLIRKAGTCRHSQAHYFPITAFLSAFLSSTLQWNSPAPFIRRYASWFSAISRSIQASLFPSLVDSPKQESYSGKGRVLISIGRVFILGALQI